MFSVGKRAGGSKKARLRIVGDSYLIALLQTSPLSSTFPDPYFLCSLLSANFSAVSSASAALTFTSGSTPISAQLDRLRFKSCRSDRLNFASTYASFYYCQDDLADIADRVPRDVVNVPLTGLLVQADDFLSFHVHLVRC